MMFHLRSFEASSPSAVRIDDDNFSDASAGKCSPLDDALDEQQSAESSEFPEYTPIRSLDIHRHPHGARFLENSSSPPLPMSIPLSHHLNTHFNRTASSFVGVAIRQMAEQAYIGENDSDEDSDGDAGPVQQYPVSPSDYSNPFQL